MRKLKLQVQISVDGFVSGPGGGMDWMVWDWDAELQSFVGELTETVDTILLGRKMAGGFIAHWAGVAADPEHPQYESGKIFTDTWKVVFSKSLAKSDWPNTEIAAGDLTTEVNRLKNQKGKDLIVYGGASFVSSLIKHGLIDEYYLFVNPAALGNGLGIFKDLEESQPLGFVKAIPFACGIVLLHYVPKTV